MQTKCTVLWKSSRPVLLERSVSFSIKDKPSQMVWNFIIICLWMVITETNKKTWRCRGSNPGPFTCKANALPLSYIPIFEWSKYFNYNSDNKKIKLLSNIISYKYFESWKFNEHRKFSFMIPECKITMVYTKQNILRCTNFILINILIV
jgi:hypothetical protein